MKTPPSVASAGLQTWQARGILARLQGIDFVGMDIVAVMPAYDIGEVTALAVASMICFDMGPLVERAVSLTGSTARPADE